MWLPLGRWVLETETKTHLDVLKTMSITYIESFWYAVRSSVLDSLLSVASPCPYWSLPP